MVHKITYVILIFCYAAPSFATFGEIFKDTLNRKEGLAAKHGSPGTYSTPIFQYGPPKVNFNPHDKFASFGDLLKKPGLKSISKISHGPRIPINYKKVGPKPIFGPPKRHFFVPPPQSQVKGHCDGWIPILGPSVHELHAPHPLPAPAFETTIETAGGHDLHPPPISHTHGAASFTINTEEIQGPPPSTSYGVPVGIESAAVNFPPPLTSYGAPAGFEAAALHAPPPPPPSTSYGVPVAAHTQEISAPVAVSGFGTSEVHVPATSYGPPPTGNVAAIPEAHVQQVYGPPQATADIVAQEVVQHHFGTIDNNLHAQDLGHAGIFGGNDLSGGFDIVKSHGIELTPHSFVDSYNQLPPPVNAPTASYGPPHASHGHSLPIGPLLHHVKFHKSPPIFNAHKSNLGIRYGSISGNLKPWPIPGKPAKHPISFRPPVPHGLIESIGHQVEHLDKYGVKMNHHNNVYIPPPPSPLPIPDLHSLPLEQPAAHFLTQHHDYNHQLALDSNQVAYTHHATCTHGPNLVNGYHAQVPGFAVYDTAASTNIVSEQKVKGEDYTSYGPPATGTVEPIVEETKQEPVQPLPGLEGLDVVSAQRSQSVDIPAQAPEGKAYDIQFQQSIEGTSQSGVHLNHDQILNNGLLQSIISAVEQPQQNEVVPQPVTDDDQNPDYSEVKIIFNKDKKNASDDKQEPETPKESS